MLHAPGGHLRAGVEAELAADTLDVPLSRSLADHEAQLEAHQVKLLPLDQAQCDRLVSELERQLGGAAFAAAWAAGRAMTLAQATAAATEIN
jgi:hypothetical protein